MSLLTAHKVLVVTAVLFCAGFAVREAMAVVAGADGVLVPLILDPAAERRRRARDN